MLHEDYLYSSFNKGLLEIAPAFGGDILCLSKATLYRKRLLAFIFILISYGHV